MPNDRNSLLKMGKRVLTSAPPVVPLETMENEFLKTEEQLRTADHGAKVQPTSLGSQGGTDLTVFTRSDGNPTVQPVGSAVSQLAAHTPSNIPAVQLAVQPEQNSHAALKSEVQNRGTRLVPRSGRKRVLTVSATFRLPEELHTRLKRISQHNQIDMTDITIEALELHLSNFSDPG